MKTIQAADCDSYRRMTSDELRGKFLVADLFQPGQAEFFYTNVDSAVVGGIVPTDKHLALEGGKEMACDFFCERREVWDRGWRSRWPRPAPILRRWM